MVYTVVYRCFHIFTELTFLKGIFCKNGYPENLIDKCFKKFLNIHLVKENAHSLSILRNIFFTN